MWVCECVCVCQFFVYVISRSSSVRFRHKAQTPETREYTSIFTISLLLVWLVPLCSPTLWAGKTHSLTHSPGISNIIYIVYTKEQWLYRKSIEHIKNRKRGANIVVVIKAKFLSSPISLSLARALHYFLPFASLQPHLLAHFSFWTNFRADRF